MTAKTGFRLNTLTSKVICRNTTTFIYDRTINSHNRSLDERALKAAEEEDLEWFRSLSEAEKIRVLIGLVRMSSGAMVLKLQQRLKPLYRQRLITKSDCVLKLFDPEVPEKMGGKLDEKLHGLVKGDYEEIQYDPKDPLTVEV